MKIHGVICLKCKDFVYSRARHDFRACGCGTVAADGGLDYLKISGLEYAQVSTRELDVTPRQLYDDWNKRIDKLGIIKPEKKEKNVKR